MRNRRGRKRKQGARYPSGKLRPASPREVAASQPHRRGLGDLALDQLAESELGRMALRGEVTREQYLAGETFRDIERRYRATIEGPQALTNGNGRGMACDGCPAPESAKFCRCDLLKRISDEARSVLLSTGGGVGWVVLCVAVDGMACPQEFLGWLRLGLSALAYHFGLAKKPVSSYRNVTAQITNANGHVVH